MNTQLQRLNRLRETQPVYQEVLELGEKIWQEKNRAKTQWSFPQIIPDSNEARIQMDKGFPFLRSGQIPLDPTQTRNYFFRLLEIFKEQNPGKQEALVRSMETHGFQFVRSLHLLLEKGLTENLLEEEMGKEGSLLFFFIVQSLKPAFEVQGENWRKSHKELFWTYGYCPFCGGNPAMGEIREEGKRVLHCLLCATTWDYPRMKCPYCGNKNQQELTYFQVEGEAAYRVDLCLHCRNYLKTVDGRERAESLDWEIEDYLTLHLDHLAQKEGYGRPAGLFAKMP